jgi:hypothetical protein
VIPPNDSFFETELRGIAPRPIFIIGLHRSGTTFLYQTLAGVFPVASLTVYHVVDYDRLLLHHHDGTAEAAGRELDRIFRSWGMATRRIDDVALSHAMPEEYGWILRRRGGSFHTNPRTAPLVDEICRKLRYVTPAAEAVLLKNPWDTGHVKDLLARFADARFIFLRRDPVAIVNSQFRIAKYFGGTKDPFVNMLFSGIPSGRIWMWLQRSVRRAAGERRHGWIALRFILRDVACELGRFEASWSVVPSPRRLALDYEELVSRPDEVLERVSAFLGLAVRRNPVRSAPRPRDSTLLPEVAAVEAAFRRRLRERAAEPRPPDAGSPDRPE